MSETILITIAASVLLGVFGQLLASVTRMPSIVFLLGLGVAAGPFGLNLVRPASLGEGLPVLTAAFVAIILFEGALTLPPRLLKDAISPVHRLVTVGALVSLTGAALLARFITGLPWPAAVLFGALVVVTGPTVIAPVLKRVRLLPRLHAVLKSEAILIDVVGAITAVVILEYLLAVGAGWRETFDGFAGRIGVGIVVGGTLGALTAMLVRLPLFRRRDNIHLLSLGALAVALGSYAAADYFHSESGIMATVTAGLVLAAVPLPFRDAIEEFKETLTTLGVSVVFILLSANVDLAAVTRGGWQEAAVVAGLMLAVRPASVLISTIRSPLTWPETAYLALLAPRGIVAAAMASHVAATLDSHGLPGGDRIQTLVFLTIAATVCLQGSLAGVMARWLKVGVRPTGLLLVGVNPWSLALAQELKKRKVPVRFLDVNAANCEEGRGRGFEAVRGDATHDETFEALDLSDVASLVALTPNDAINTLACDTAQGWLGETNVFQVAGKAARARGSVRMAGKIVMPAPWSHDTICTLLRREQLSVATERCDEGCTISTDFKLAGDKAVPLLVLEGDATRLAVDGAKCPKGASLVALVDARKSAA
jgi:NhaP-type Na+/H+ or K+/H+ antiporter